MYIASDYSPIQYAKLLKLKDKILQLDPQRGEFNASNCRNFLVDELGITKVREGVSKEVSLNGASWRGGVVSLAMKQVIKETRKYLDKHQAQFEQDTQDGKLKGSIENQMELPFTGYVGAIDLRHTRPSRAETLAYFLSQRRKSS